MKTSVEVPEDKKYLAMSARQLVDYYTSLKFTAGHLKKLMTQQIISNTDATNTNWTEALRKRDEYLLEVKNEIIKRIEDGEETN